MQLPRVDEAALNISTGFLRALAGSVGGHQAAVAAQVLVQIVPGARQDLAEVHGRDLDNFRADLIVDPENLSQDEYQPLPPVEAQQGSHGATDLGLFDEDLNWNRNGSRVRQVEVGYPLQAARGIVERANRHRSLLDIQNVIDGDAIQPRAKLGVAAERGQGLEGFEQHFLRGILRVGAAQQHTNREVEHPGLMARQEQFRGLAASRLRRADQFVIGSFGGGCHRDHDDLLR